MPKTAKGWRTLPPGTPQGAYAVTFLSRERVRVASNDLARIQEYQDLRARRQQDAVDISDTPCAGPVIDRIASLYVCKP